MAQQRQFKCYACNHEWEAPYGVGGSGRNMVCPKCGSSNIHRVDTGGPPRGTGTFPGGRGRGRGGFGRGMNSQG